jgi:hypothetical protein
MISTFSGMPPIPILVPFPLGMITPGVQDGCGSPADVFDHEADWQIIGSHSFPDAGKGSHLAWGVGTLRNRLGLRDVTGSVPGRREKTTQHAMPRRMMTISKEAYKALETVVGSKYLSDDPAICEGYRSGPGGYESGLGYERVMTKIPGAVILPRTTEEVQKIVKICNRYKVPYVPYSTGFYGPRSHCHVKNELLIDLKRMNDFEIDEKYCTVPL